MSKKNVDELSSAELFELAKKRQEEEAEKQREAAAKEIEELKARRKKVTAQYRKDLRAIDAKLQALSGRRRRRSGGRGRITERILEIVAASGPTSTKDIRQQLEADGIEAANLSQILGTLKKSGRLVSPGRAMYAIAG